MLNNVSLQGRFTAAPELRTTSNGKMYVKFALACERDFADANGNRGTDFISCTAWGKTAEFISKYFTKGSMVAIVGRIETRSWTTDSGEKKYTTEVNVDRSYFCGSKSTNSATQQMYGDQTKDLGGYTEVDDDDLPF